MKRGPAPRAPHPITVRVQPRDGVPLTERAGLAQREIDAEVFGRYGVHRDPRPDHVTYNVTYIPEGLSVADGMDHAQAVRLAEVLASVLDVEPWDAAKHVPIAKREVSRIRGAA